MLTDPLSVSSTICGGATTITLSLVASDVASAVRKGTASGDLEAPLILKIARSESKENKGIITDRVSLRLETRKSVIGVGDIVAQTTMTTSYPRLGFTQSEILNLMTSLIAIITHDNTGLDYAARFLNGEG